MKIFSIFLLFVLLAGIVPMVGAQDPANVDNACDESGSMAGKCTTDWHWNCGWYIARYERGEYNLLQVPTDCAESLIIPYLPPTQIAELVNLIQAINTLCHTNGSTKHCMSSDQTGFADLLNDGVLNWLAVFVTNLANCPAGYYPSAPTTAWGNVGFTPQEISSLGMNPYYCGKNLP